MVKNRGEKPDRSFSFDPETTPNERAARCWREAVKDLREGILPWSGKAMLFGTGGDGCDTAGLSEIFYNPYNVKIVDEQKVVVLMEDKNKYYTPLIEEFHVGFEFEYLNIVYEYPAELTGENKLKIKGNAVKTQSWDKAVYSSNFFSYVDDEEDYGVGDNLDAYIELQQVRVKKLDKEDIEELGFNCITNSSVPQGNFFKHKIQSEISIQIVSYNDRRGASTYIIETLDAANVNVVFKGFIKNKSELKKILKMVSYES